MRGLILQIQKSLTAKLVIAISFLAVLGSCLLLMVILRAEKRTLLEDAVAQVTSYSELTKKSIRYDMLNVKRQEIQLSLESIGSSQLILKTSILDPNGKIMFSSHLGEIGKLNGRQVFQETGLGKQWQVTQSDSGSESLSFLEPILNEPDCINAACHFHPSDQQILGYLYTDFSLAAHSRRIQQHTVDIIIYMLSFIALLAIITSLIIWKFVVLPVTSLASGMKKISAGDLQHQLQVPSQDEIGSLTSTFNAMATELASAKTRLEKWNQSLEAEVRKKTDEIRQAQDRLIQVEKLAAQGRLTAEVAHQIRNPLTALGGFGRRLQKTAITDKQKEYADILVAEVSRLEDILRDVLSFSSQPRLTLERQPVSAVVQESILLFKENCLENGIDLELVLESNLPVFFEHDQIRQAINNLILNAIDMMPDGGRMTITTRAVCKNNLTYVAILVTDNGPGIPEENLPRVFEPFFTTKKAGKGTGLGLSICRKIIEEHGGFIWAQNLSDKSGLEIGLYFPYQSEEENRNIPCWEFKKCGRDKNRESKCPAFPNFGRSCWAVAGTLCAGKIQGTFAQKYNDCRRCDFFLQTAPKEANPEQGAWHDRS